MRFPLGHLLLVALALSPAGARAQSHSLDSYALFATDQLRSKGMTIHAGDVGVNLGAIFARGTIAAHSSTLVADTARLAPGSSCAALFTGLLVGSSPACGPLTPFTGPIIAEDVGATCGIPDTFPPCGTERVLVGNGGSRVLPPGPYGDVLLMGGGAGSSTLILQGGEYRFCSVRVARGSRVLFDSASQVFVMGDVRLSTLAQVIPAPGATVTPPDIRLFVDGTNVRVSRGAAVTGRLCAPGATFSAQRGATLDGSFVARRIRADRVVVDHTGFPEGGSTTTVTTTTQTSTSTTTTVTTTSSSTMPPCAELCGNGTIDPACNEQCDTGSANGAFVSVECPSCEHCLCVSTSTTVVTTTTSTSIPADCPQRCGNGTVDAECNEQCDIGSAESAFVSPECPSCTECRCLTTSTSVVTTTTSTSIPGDCPQRCGNGVVDAECNEQCDGSARGAFDGPCPTCDQCRCSGGGSTTTTLPVVAAEICGNCIDDDANAALDFEDPACCSQAQTISMELKHARLRPFGTTSRLRLRAFLARSGMDDIDPTAEDVYLQARTSAGEVLCAKIPVGKFRQHRKTFKFKDRKHTVPSAFALDRVVIRVRKNHTVLFRAAGRRVGVATPTPGSLRLTVAFRNPLTAETTNRCSAVRSAEFRTGPKGSIRFP